MQVQHQGSQSSTCRRRRSFRTTTYGRTKCSCTFLKPGLGRTWEGKRQPGSRQALVTLTGLNILNFMDRYMPAAVKPGIQKDLSISDYESTMPALGMKIVFMISSLLVGSIADAEVIDRRILLAIGVVIWSLATAAAGWAQNLMHLIIMRSFVGVGEAVFATIAMPMIADFYPADERNRAYTLFGLGAPLGAAIGFGIGSAVSQFAGWHYAFFICGFPGLLSAVGVLMLNDPPVGINDGEVEEEGDVDCSSGDDSSQTFSSSSEASNEGSTPPPCCQEAREVLTNPHWLLSTAGMVAIQFAIGGLTEWYPTYMYRYVKMEEAFAGLVLSGTSVIGGIGGTILGASLADRLVKRYGVKSYILVPAFFTIPGAALASVAVNFTYEYLVVAALLLGQVCFFTYTAPITALSISVVPSHVRARASSLQNLAIHTLGDMVSPIAIGETSEAYNLHLAMQWTWSSILVAGCFWFSGYACLEDPDIHADKERMGKGKLTQVLARTHTGP